MGLLRDIGSEDIRELPLDRPEGVDETDVSVSNGTRVVLSYQGEPLAVQVTAVERLGASFVGEILRYDAANATGMADPTAPAPGNSIRFRLKDVFWTE